MISRLRKKSKIILKKLFELENIFRGAINKSELRIIALRRSGHHAIIEWILSNLQGEYYFLNECMPNRNPFTTCNVSNSLYTAKSMRLERLGRFSKKDFLIYNYESHDFTDIFAEKFDKQHDKWVGKSLKIINILILRDPFNLFASRVMFGYKNAGHEIYGINKKKLNKLVGLYKLYAKEYLGETNYVSNKVNISYNNWLSDEEYRREVLKRLGMPILNTNINRVSKYGDGSSFGQKCINSKKDKMELMERWKKFAGDKFYRNIFNDTELVELSKKIFGTIPGTEILYRAD